MQDGVSCLCWDSFHVGWRSWTEHNHSPRVSQQTRECSFWASTISSFSDSAVPVSDLPILSRNSSRVAVGSFPSWDELSPLLSPQLPCSMLSSAAGRWGGNPPPVQQVTEPGSEAVPCCCRLFGWQMESHKLCHYVLPEPVTVVCAVQGAGVFKVLFVCFGCVCVIL